MWKRINNSIQEVHPQLRYIAIKQNLNIFKIEKNCEFGGFQLPEVRGEK